MAPGQKANGDSLGNPFNLLFNLLHNNYCMLSVLIRIAS